MEEQKSLIAVLQGIANIIKDRPEVTKDKIAPNEFYEIVLSLAKHTFAESMVDTSGEGITKVKKLIVNDIITEVGEGAFSSSNITELTFKNGVTTISKEAFLNCRSLTTINWNKVNTLKLYSFQGCSSLKDINITEYITAIHGGAFYGATGVTTITVDNNNDYYKAEGNCIISKQEQDLGTQSRPNIVVANTLVQGCKSSEIPDDSEIVNIGNYAFAGNISPSSITIPNGVTSIGMYAFQNCSGLKTITMGDKVTTIGDAAFIGCGFSSIILPAAVSKIGTSALSTRYCSTFDFSKCNPNNPPELGGSAFGTQHPAGGWQIIIPYESFRIWSDATNWVNYKTYMRYPDGTNPNETN